MKRFLAVVAISLLLPTADLHAQDNPLDTNELRVYVENNNSQLPIALAVWNYDTMWDCSYDITSSYPGTTKQSYETAFSLLFSHCAVPPHVSQDAFIAYGKYKITVTKSAASYFIYVSFADCVYPAAPYGKADMNVHFDCSSNSFSIDEYGAVGNGQTVGIWQLSTNSGVTPSSNCFQPTDPSNLSVRKPRWSDHPRVSWTASTPSSAKYKIYRAVNSTTDFSLAYDHYQNTTWDDIGVTVPGGLTFYYKVRAESGDQQKLSDGFSNTGSISGDWIQNRPVAIEKVPEEYRLQEAYPNPFNPSTRISYELPEAAQVVLSVYNTLGEVVRLLVDEEKLAGTYEVEWDGKDDGGRDVPSGIYFCRMSAGSFAATNKMILLK